MSGNTQAAEQGQKLDQERRAEKQLRESLGSASRTFDDLLHAAEGLKELGDLLTVFNGESEYSMEVGRLVYSMGRHIQTLRNQAARELRPAFEKLGAEPIGY